MKLKIKNFFIYLFFVILIFSLFSCKKSTKIKTITIWSGIRDIKATLKKIANEFQKENKNIKIKIVQIPFTDLQTKYQIAAPAYAGPDLLIAPHDWAGVLTIANLIDNIDNTYNSKNFINSSIKAVSIKNHIYALPLYAETIALFYNLDVLMPEDSYKFKPYIDFKQVIEKSKELRKNNLYGIVFDVNNFYFVWPFFSAFNVYIFKNKDNWQDIGLNSDNAVNSALYIKSLIDNNIISDSMTLDNASDLFIKNKAGMIINGPWFLETLKKNKINYLITKLPLINNKELKPFIGFMCIYLNKRSKNKKMAKKFIKFLAKKENQKLIYQSAKRIPVFKELIKESEQNPDIKGFIPSLLNGIPMPNTPAMTQIWQKMKDALTLINSYKGNDKRKKVKEILNRYVKDMKESIKFMME